MFKNIFFIIFAAALALIVSLSIVENYGLNLFEKKNESADKKIIVINNKKLEVEVADEPQKQFQGLAGRDSLGKNKGMLFVFPQPTSPGFWMKNMKFSLDLIWIDGHGKIIHISKDISPDTYPQIISSSSPVKYVLEVNGGWTDRNKIKIGDIVMSLY